MRNVDELRYEDLKKAEEEEFDFDVRNSVRAEVKLRHFENQCTAVIDVSVL